MDSEKSFVLLTMWHLRMRFKSEGREKNNTHTHTTDGSELVERQNNMKCLQIHFTEILIAYFLSENDMNAKSEVN